MTTSDKIIQAIWQKIGRIPTSTRRSKWMK